MVTRNNGGVAALASVFALSGILLTLTACDKREPAAPASLAAKVETMEWLAPDCKRAEDCTSVVVKREIFADRPALNDAVRLQLIEQLQGNGEAPVAAAADTSLEQVARAFIDDAAEVSEMSSAHWQMTGDAKKLAQRGNLLTVEISSYIYSGGAHGMPVTDWLNWDLAAGKKVTLSDMIKPGQEDAFWAVAEKVHKQWQDTQQLDESFRNNWPFSQTENFRLSNEGLVLLYGVYTLAPYSAGQVELTLPWASVGDLLRAPFVAVVP